MAVSFPTSFVLMGRSVPIAYLSPRDALRASKTDLRSVLYMSQACGNSIVWIWPLA